MVVMYCTNFCALMELLLSGSKQNSQYLFAEGVRFGAVYMYDVELRETIACVLRMVLPTCHQCLNIVSHNSN